MSRSSPCTSRISRASQTPYHASEQQINEPILDILSLDSFGPDYDYISGGFFISIYSLIYSITEEFHGITFFFPKGLKGEIVGTWVKALLYIYIAFFFRVCGLVGVEK